MSLIGRRCQWRAGAFLALGMLLGIAALWHIAKEMTWLNGKEG
jgi:hypothetical protein